MLSAIKRLGSIRQAAAEMQMSYRQAWGHLRTAEKRLRMQLIVTKVGAKPEGEPTDGRGQHPAGAFERLENLWTL